MKVKIFTYHMYDTDSISSVESKINEFCSMHDIIDIKVACMDLDVVYTILYR